MRYKISTLMVAAVVVSACSGSAAESASGGTAIAPAPTPTATVAAPTPTPSPSPTSTPVARATPACERVTADPVSLSPYSDPAFKQVIDNARSFQWPTSLNACMNTAQLQAYGVDLDNFYRDSAGRMVFSIRGGTVSSDSSDTTRMELRGMSFDATSSGKVLDASFQLPAIEGRSTSFTISQVYGESAGLPIVRIFFASSRNGLTDHLWIAYRKGTGDSDGTSIDLGPAPAEGQTARVRITYNVGDAIEVYYSGSNLTTRLTENLAFWAAAGKTAYFKSGCYLQAAGNCEVRFTALAFDR
ncbi:polysaccharide lyase family 7 protein [Sphingomonas sp. KR3-1]|uniref:polysaccharide lyase family 7 protein n=1 Tax=Sphingomonas sp. KR3-1 TaxID=3156611 RepID=UPI0032B60B28